MRFVVPAFFALLAACGSIQPAETPTGPHFKVLTYNVNYGGPGADQARQAILDEDADIVCLQETTAAWERFLRPELSKIYPHVRFHHSGGAGGLAIFSKWAVTEPELVESPVGWFPAWIFVATTPVGQVQIGVFHLHPGVNENGSFTPYAYLSAAPKARLKETNAFYRRLVPGFPTLLLGDFNEGDAGRSIGWLGERGLKDALPKFDTSAKTWHWTSYGITVKHRLDHILYSDDLYCLDARVREKGASDHYPVIAVFERR